MNIFVRLSISELKLTLILIYEHGNHVVMAKKANKKTKQIRN